MKNEGKTLLLEGVGGLKGVVRSYCVGYWLIMLMVMIAPTRVGAAGVNDAGLKSIFRVGSRVVQNTVASAAPVGRMATEIIMSVPYQGIPSEYKVEFCCRRQILEPARQQSETIVKQKLSQFIAGNFFYWDDIPMTFAEPGSTSEPVDPQGHLRMITVYPPQRQKVMNGWVWSQRTDETFEGKKHVYYECHYAVLIGDFVATLDVPRLPDCRKTADQWFKKLVMLCKPN